MKADATFWEARYEQPDFIYGTRPNAFLAAQAGVLAPGSTAPPFA